MRGNSWDGDKSFKKWGIGGQSGPNYPEMGAKVPKLE